MDEARRKFLIEQQGISIVLNGLISALFVWLMFRHLDRIPFWGLDGLLLDLVPTTFMITLMMTLGLTIITRKAAAAGRLPREGATRLPRRVALRALVLALVMTLLLVPATGTALWLLWTGSWSFAAALAFKIAYGIVLGLIVTPVVIGAALADPPPRWAAAG